MKKSMLSIAALVLMTAACKKAEETPALPEPFLHFY
jgi:nitrous oxide reductase accessory protein NosL